MQSIHFDPDIGAKMQLLFLFSTTVIGSDKQIKETNKLQLQSKIGLICCKYLHTD